MGIRGGTHSSSLPTGMRLWRTDGIAIRQRPTLTFLRQISTQRHRSILSTTKATTCANRRRRSSLYFLTAALSIRLLTLLRFLVRPVIQWRWFPVGDGAVL